MILQYDFGIIVRNESVNVLFYDLLRVILHQTHSSCSRYIVRCRLYEYLFHIKVNPSFPSCPEAFYYFVQIVINIVQWKR